MSTKSPDTNQDSEEKSMEVNGDHRIECNDEVGVAPQRGNEASKYRAVLG